MREKLNCVLLIDDDEPTNFLHKYLIEKSGYAEKCVTLQNGEEALAYLKSKDDGEYPHPNLIFLDINMPGMNGWEFLEAYKDLDKVQQGDIVVVMLTTSLDPDDQIKADAIADIRDFRNKPLTIDAVEQIIRTHFADKI
jgi:CheY-like chemotaxis protein